MLGELGMIQKRECVKVARVPGTAISYDPAINLDYKLYLINLFIFVKSVYY